MSDDLQAAKAVVRSYYQDLDSADPGSIGSAIAAHTARDYNWRGMHPFHEQVGAAAVAEAFWEPFVRAFSPVQRREDVFMAGRNDVDGGKTTWVANVGNLLGLFDAPWLGIPPTGKIAFLRYAEFHRVADGKIAETVLFCDVISVMHQAGHYPLPPMTGAGFIYPGPRTHDGLLHAAQEAAEGRRTMELVNAMIGNLDEANRIGNETGDNRPPASDLERYWHDDMLWYGPFGIGASYTIERYQKQHQYPFRLNLVDKQFNGHIARFAEGTYAGFFGWANLTLRASGGFMGLPGNNEPADMRVVDIYRRDGDKLAENWVFIDLLHWLSIQGLDVLARMRENLPGSEGP